METTKYRARLEEEKARLEKELPTVGRPNPSNPNDWETVSKETELEPDPNDRADQMEHFSENNAILADLETRYNEVKGALARIEEGTYGTCRVCGKEIEVERLEADPSADTCLEHKNQ